MIGFQGQSPWWRSGATRRMGYRETGTDGVTTLGRPRSGCAIIGIVASGTVAAWAAPATQMRMPESSPGNGRGTGPDASASPCQVANTASR